MAKPTNPAFIFASDAVYTTGAPGVPGTPTKANPGAGKLAEGWNAEPALARHSNYIWNAVSEWTFWVSEAKAVPTTEEHLIATDASGGTAIDHMAVGPATDGNDYGIDAVANATRAAVRATGTPNTAGLRAQGDTDFRAIEAFGEGASGVAGFFDATSGAIAVAGTSDTSTAISGISATGIGVYGEASGGILPGVEGVGTIGVRGEGTAFPGIGIVGIGGATPNGPGGAMTGGGTGEGLSATGGSAGGIGVRATGRVSATGLVALGGPTDGVGASCTGMGAGTGAICTGGASGIGLSAAGGGGATGVYGTSGTGRGGQFDGGGSSHGVLGQSGTTGPACGVFGECRNDTGCGVFGQTSLTAIAPSAGIRGVGWTNGHAGRFSSVHNAAVALEYTGSGTSCGHLYLVPNVTEPTAPSPGVMWLNQQNLSTNRARLGLRTRTGESHYAFFGTTGYCSATDANSGTLTITNAVPLNRSVDWRVVPPDGSTFPATITVSGIAIKQGGNAGDTFQIQVRNSPGGTIVFDETFMAGIPVGDDIPFSIRKRYDIPAAPGLSNYEARFTYISTGANQIDVRSWYCTITPER